MYPRKERKNNCGDDSTNGTTQRHLPAASRHSVFLNCPGEGKIMAGHKVLLDYTLEKSVQVFTLSN
jgi:hypothetical protein